MKLTTLLQYHKMSPLSQGYVVYMEAAWPGSELRGQTNLYKPGSKKYDLWVEGQRRAVQCAQDSEE